MSNSISGSAQKCLSYKNKQWRISWKRVSEQCNGWSKISQNSSMFVKTKNPSIFDIRHRLQNNRFNLFWWGEICFNYKGVLSTGKREPFEPSWITCNRRGNILVADVCNDVIHLLKSNGEFVNHVLTPISQISQPCGICVYKVWVVETNKNSGEII